ncbi:hypothetical protein B9Z55_028885 [Caenorhabditis nigoni]|uniref:Uncharacterized protein n=1 Tax=Caenorhabditis nigoni TaxID=1611254 RepID=A0A2G5S9P4_9PELO|nr:hypothetical protein B9Z55_028885 [Caenorhabditis nigoni]
MISCQRDHYSKATRSSEDSLRTTVKTPTRYSLSTRSDRQPQEDRSWPWSPFSMFILELCCCGECTRRVVRRKSMMSFGRSIRREERIVVFGSEPLFKNRATDIQGDRPGRPKEKMALKDAAAAIGRNISKNETLSDWTVDELRRAQQHYAAMDVVILQPLYREWRRLNQH